MACFCSLGVLLCDWRYWYIKVTRVFYIVWTMQGDFFCTWTLELRDGTLLLSICGSTLESWLQKKFFFSCMLAELNRMDITEKSGLSSVLQLDKMNTYDVDQLVWNEICVAYHHTVPHFQVENVVTFSIKDKPFQGHGPNVYTLRISDRSQEKYFVSVSHLRH